MNIEGISTVEDVTRQVNLLKKSMCDSIDSALEAVVEDAQLRGFINLNADASPQIARLIFLLATHQKYHDLEMACIDRSSRMDVIEKLKEHVKRSNERAA